MSSSARQRVVGSARLARRVASGAAGETWRAVGPSGAPCAVKILHAHLAANAEARALFTHEVALLRALGPPSAPALLEHGEAEGRPFLTTAWVPGLDLQDLEPPWPVGVAVALGLRACHALAALHALADAGGSLEAVHQDVSPSNLRLSASGRLVLLDLGVARSRWLAPGLRQTARGTVRTSAPEQVRGEGADARADVFGLGATLHEGLAAAPFRAATGPALLLAAADAPPPSLAARRPALPRAIAEAIDRATAAAADDRWPGALAFAAALAGAAGSAGVAVADDAALDAFLRECARVLSRAGRPV